MYTITVETLVKEKKMNMDEMDNLLEKYGLKGSDTSKKTTSDEELEKSLNNGEKALNEGNVVLRENENGTYNPTEDERKSDSGENQGRRIEDVLIKYINGTINEEAKKTLEKRLRNHYYNEAMNDENEAYEEFCKKFENSMILVKTEDLEKYGTRFFLVDEIQKIRKEKGADWNVSYFYLSDLTYSTKEGDIKMKAGEKLDIDTINAIKYLNGKLMGNAVKKYVRLDRIIHSPNDFEKNINKGEEVTLFELDFYKNILKNVEKDKKITFLLNARPVFEYVNKLKENGEHNYNQKVKLDYDWN